MIYQALNKAIEAHQPVVLCTIVETQGAVPRHAGTKLLVYADGSTKGTVGGGEVENLVISQALDALHDGKPRLNAYNLVDVEKGDAGICGGSLKVYLEPILPAEVLLVIGAGHVGKAVVHLAQWLGYRVVLSDERAALCCPEVVPGADVYLPVKMAELPENMTITPQTYIVVVTKGADVDIEGLPVLMASDAAYLGVIGSKKRWAHTKAQLIQNGTPESAFSAVKSPIGLFIHAETPEEIAVSIMAEVIERKNNQL